MKRNRSQGAAPNGSPRGLFKGADNFTDSVTDASSAASAPSPCPVLLPSAALREPVSVMKLAFLAKFVECSDALGGDLLRVDFDTLQPDADEDMRQSPWVSIGRLFEFPGDATVDWHDGSDSDGGAKIVSGALSPNHITIRLNQGRTIEIGFSLSEKQFANLKSSLTKMLGHRITVCERIPEPD